MTEISEYEPKPQVKYRVSVLDSPNPQIETQIEQINKAHWYTEKTSSDATKTGFTIPGEYGGDIKSRIGASLKSDSSTKFLYITEPAGQVIGYREVEIYPQGEDPQDFRNVYNIPEVQDAIRSPHMEGRESAIHPEWRTLKDPLGFKPSEVLLQETEKLCREQNLPYLFIWIIGHRGPNIPNKASWKFFTRHGFRPVLTAEGDVDGTRAAGLYKKIT